MNSKRTFASALLMAALLVVTVLAPAAGAQTRGRGRTPTRPPAPAPAPAPAPTPAPDPSPGHGDEHSTDAHFVAMMIPHHHQALLMSGLAPSRSSSSQVRALASRIDIEQGIEISMMQSWQVWNGLEVTDPAQAYQELLGMPHHLAEMGMATPQQMAALSASSGTAFDRMYLELMIRHHQGAVDMLVDVILHGSDETLSYWATDMLVAQEAQIGQMQQMLDGM